MLANSQTHLQIGCSHFTFIWICENLKCWQRSTARRVPSDTRCPTQPEHDKCADASIDPLRCQIGVKKWTGLQGTGSDQTHSSASACKVVHVSLRRFDIWIWTDTQQPAAACFYHSNPQVEIKDNPAFGLCLTLQSICVITAKQWRISSHWLKPDFTMGKTQRHPFWDLSDLSKHAKDSKAYSLCQLLVQNQK